MADLLDFDLLDEDDPFEIDEQAAHLLKHASLGIDDIYDVWRSDPLFYPAKPPAHWLMVSEVAGRVLVVPLAPTGSGDPYEVSAHRLLRRRRTACQAIPGGPMTAKKMTRKEEFEFYAKPENQEPQGPPRRRKSKLTELVPVRFPPETLEEIRRRAGEDDRSVSSWIRRAVEHKLHEETG